jgi:threonylcarbamoyladenosine tRNA methylthiotransferase MtaB
MDNNDIYNNNDNNVSNFGSLNLNVSANTTQYKVYLVTFGCKVNYAETQRIAEEFVEQGILLADNINDADILVINTCSVTKKADADARKAIRHSLKINPNLYVIITGCAVEINPFQFSSIEGADLIIPNNEKFNILKYSNDFKKLNESKIIDSKIENVQFQFAYSNEEDSRSRAVLKIQDGCEYNCSYCTIPLARGHFRSMPFDEIIPAVEKIKSNGFNEIVLVGINLSEYQFQHKRFLDVLKLLEESDIDIRIRISSIEPNILNDEIIKFIAKSQKICHHFHIPLQSGSNNILKLMRRRYTAEQFKAKIDLISQYIPDAGIGIDVITGFPDETEEYFQETYNLLDNLAISYLHVFSYSERDNTLAITMQNKIPEKIKKERTNILRELSKRKTEIFYKNQLGKIREVIFEKKLEDDSYFGHSDNYIPVITKSKNDIINTRMNIKLISLIMGKIKGEIV